LTLDLVQHTAPQSLTWHRTEEELKTIKQIMTPWGKVLLEKLKDPQLDKKLPTFYGTICFQQSITYSCPEPDKSSPHPPNLFMVHFNIILPSIPRPSKHSLSFMFSNKNPVCITLLPHVWHMPYPSHPLYHPNNTWHEVQVLKLLLNQFSPTSCYFLPLVFFLTSSQLPIVEHLHPVIVSLTWTKFHSHIKQQAKS